MKVVYRRIDRPSTTSLLCRFAQQELPGFEFSSIQVNKARWTAPEMEVQVDLQSPGPGLQSRYARGQEQPWTFVHHRTRRFIDIYRFIGVFFQTFVAVEGDYSGGWLWLDDGSKLGRAKNIRSPHGMDASGRKLTNLKMFIFESWFSPNPRIGFSGFAKMISWGTSGSNLTAGSLIVPETKSRPGVRAPKIGWVAPGPRWLPSVDVVTLWHLGLSNGNTTSVEGAPKDTSFFSKETNSSRTLCFFVWISRLILDVQS